MTSAELLILLGKIFGALVKSYVKISAPGGVFYLAPDDVIATIATWYQPEYRLILKALITEVVPLPLMPLRRTPHYFESESQAQHALTQVGKEISAIRKWVNSGKSDLFTFIEECDFTSIDPSPIDAEIAHIDVPDGHGHLDKGEPRWYVTTYYRDQGYLFLVDQDEAESAWIKERSEGAAWSSATEVEALAKAKMITRTESVYAYPRFCTFN